MTNAHKAATMLVILLAIIAVLFVLAKPGAIALGKECRTADGDVLFLGNPDCLNALNVSGGF